MLEKWQTKMFKKNYILLELEILNGKYDKIVGFDKILGKELVDEDYKEVLKSKFDICKKNFEKNFPKK